MMAHAEAIRALLTQAAAYADNGRPNSLGWPGANRRRVSELIGKALALLASASQPSEAPAAPTRGTCDRLANAIQMFRNLPMLGRMVKLRGTPEYAELVAAWDAWRDDGGEPLTDWAPSPPAPEAQTKP